MKHAPLLMNRRVTSYREYRNVNPKRPRRTVRPTDMSNDGVESRIKIDKFPENALDEKVKSATRVFLPHSVVLVRELSHLVN